MIKLINLLELEINRSKTWDLTEENWPNLSSAIFDQIKINDIIIMDHMNIGIGMQETKYKIINKEYDDTLDEEIIEYFPLGKTSPIQFLSRGWFDDVSQEL